MATYMYNEHDVNQVKNMQKKIKKKKQKRRRCFVLIVLIIIACIIFMTGNASKVKKISVSGCHLTNQENIIEHISIKSKDNSDFTSASEIFTLLSNFPSYVISVSSLDEYVAILVLQ